MKGALVGMRKLLSAVSADTAKATMEFSGELQDLTILVVSAADVTGGVVTVSEAHDKDFDGTWSDIDTVTTAAGNRCYALHLQGKFKALKVAVTTEITGGADPSVDVYVL